MKHFFFIVISILFSCHCSYSQEKIEITYERDAQGNYKFYSNNLNFCNYIVEITFSSIVNLQSSNSNPFVKEVSPGKTFLFELKSSNTQLSSNFNYTYRYFKGCINPTVKNDFTYLLPIKPGNGTEAFMLTYFRINEQQPEAKDWYAIGLKMNLGDTVYAARRGIVSHVRDTAHLKLSGYSYTSEENYLEIYHDDCSFGTYQVLDKIFLNPGEKVEAGDPIGLVGGKNYTMGPHVRFLVSYNYQDMVSNKKEGEKGKKFYNAYVPLYFHTKESGKIRLEYGIKYTSEHPDSLIIQEMNKREIKKWNKKMNQPR